MDTAGTAPRMRWRTQMESGRLADLDATDQVFAGGGGRHVHEIGHACHLYQFPRADFSKPRRPRWTQAGLSPQGHRATCKGPFERVQEPYSKYKSSA